MAALTTGVHAPDFTLQTVQGKQFSLTQALKNGPVVLAFFKVGCPVCQYAFPYFERFSRALKGRPITIIGVSQDDLSDTKRFMKDFGITFDIALDDENNYAVSRAFGLTNVPTVFEIAPDGNIERSIVGWSRDEMEEIYTRHSLQAKSAPLYAKDEEIAAFRAG